MELPVEVLIHNEILGLKGARGSLLNVSAGYYEAIVKFGENDHRVYLPIAATVIISREPEEKGSESLEIER